MTEKQFITKIKSMKQDMNKDIEERALRLFRSGGVDTSSYVDNYALPKVILYVALKEIAEQYRPLSQYMADAKNLEHF